MTSGVTKERVLILGSSRIDTGSASYKSTLDPYYDVLLHDLVDELGQAVSRWLPVPSHISRTLMSGFSNVVWRDPIAVTIPRLKKVLSDFAPDIVLVTMPDLLKPSLVKELRVNRSTKVLAVFSDHLANFGRQYLLAADYDAIFFKDRFIVDFMRHKIEHTNVFYLPQACDPTLHRTVELTDDDRKRYEADIAIAGNIRVIRAEQLWALRDYKIKQWGAAPPRWFDHPSNKFHAGKEVAGTEKCKALLASKIALNDNHHAEMAGTNKRTFEIAAIGAFQLTDTPALKDVFVPEEEVAHYVTLRDLREKVAYYLKEPDKRAAMALKAQKRAHAEHTYAHRWAAKLEVVGKPLPTDFPVTVESLKIRATTGSGTLRYPP